MTDYVILTRRFEVRANMQRELLSFQQKAAFDKVRRRVREKKRRRREGDSHKNSDGDNDSMDG